MKMIFTVLCSLILAGPSRGQEARPPGEAGAAPPARASGPYDEKADGKARIAAALARAGKENRRVLVQWGGNWCGWCIKLHNLFQKDAQVAKVLQYEYELVLVDVGRFDKNQELVQAYGAELKKHGVPYLTVLAADGKPLANQDTGSLEAGPAHDPAKVKAFLERWAATPLDAEQVLKEGLARAAKEKKLVLLHTGAPWCGWCRTLDEFLETKREVFELDYLLLKIDVDRMKGGKELSGRLRDPKSLGIPWMAILDAEGKKLVTSDGPQGNIGFPSAPEEIEHFAAMLRKTGRKIGPREVGEIESGLKALAVSRRQ